MQTFSVGSHLQETVQGSRGAQQVQRANFHPDLNTHLIIELQLFGKGSWIISLGHKIPYLVFGRWSLSGVPHDRILPFISVCCRAQCIQRSIFGKGTRLCTINVLVGTIHPTN